MGQVARLRAHRNAARDEYGEALKTIKRVEDLIATAKDLGRPDRVLTSEETAWLLKVRKVCKFTYSFGYLFLLDFLQSPFGQAL